MTHIESLVLFYSTLTMVLFKVYACTEHHYNDRHGRWFQHLDVTFFDIKSVFPTIIFLHIILVPMIELALLYISKTFNFDWYTVPFLIVLVASIAIIIRGKQLRKHRLLMEELKGK